MPPPDSELASMRDALQKKDEQLTVLRAQSEELQSTNGEYMYCSVPEYIRTCKCP